MDTQDHLNAITNLSKKELLETVGGVSISGAIIKAFSSAVDKILEVGRSLGSAIRRIRKRNLC